MLEKHIGDTESWRAAPFEVANYRELVEHVAKLSYANRTQLLFFRGQDKDYQSRSGGSTLYPAIYRVENVTEQELDYRFRELDAASRSLVRLFEEDGVAGAQDVERKKYIQWSILQHYDVVPTPLLDLTHSLRVACSFAQVASTDPTCYVYVLGLPFTSNRISINSEEDIVNIRLLSICPPSALRPYFQEGYMAGTPDVTTNFRRKTELDFRNRLIAKFAIPRAKRFWNSGFDAMPRGALYPADDQIERLCSRIRKEAAMNLREPAVAPAATQASELIYEWAFVEEILLNEARRLTRRNLPVSGAIDELATRGVLSKDVADILHRVRNVRNRAAHRSGQLVPTSVDQALIMLRGIRKRLPDTTA